MKTIIITRNRGRATERTAHYGWGRVFVFQGNNGRTSFSVSAKSRRLARVAAKHQLGDGHTLNPKHTVQ